MWNTIIIIINIEKGPKCMAGKEQLAPTYQSEDHSKRIHLVWISCGPIVDLVSISCGPIVYLV